jgi:hypothetical protein
MAAQAPPGPPKPDTVVAVVADRKITADELQRIVRSLPPTLLPNYNRDPAAFLKQYYLLQRLSDEASKNGLDKAHPYRGWLEYSRTSVMANARLHQAENSIDVSEEEFQKHLAANKTKYQRARTKVIYIAFAATPPPGSKVLTEPKARELAESIRKQVLAGADFVEMVKKHSDDKDTAARNGDYTPIRSSDAAIPEAIRKPIFELKPGQITPVIRLPNGYYLFRLEEVITPPVDEIRQEASADIRQAKFKQWMDGIDKSITVKVDNPALLRDLAR